MREFFTIAIFKIKADIRMNKTTLNSQKEKHSMLSLRRATVITTLATSRRTISIHALLAESDSKSAQNSRALLRGRDTFYGIGITILAVIGSFYPFCPCFFHIFWCEGTGGFMIAFPSH